VSDFIFPLRSRPATDYHSAPKSFGSRRSGGRRKHAGCDLYCAVGTEILAMADGLVIRGPYYFYSNTYALEVRHDNGRVVRYGEILQNVAAGVGAGARVRKGQIIARVGKLKNIRNSMLHLEMYEGTRSGRLTTVGNTYKRRADVMDPTPVLDSAPMAGEQVTSGVIAPTGARMGLPSNKVSGTLNVRERPSTDARRAFGLGRGDSFEILDEVTGGAYAQGNHRSWYRIGYRGREGYVAAYFVDADPPPEPKETVEAQEGVVSPKVKSGLNVRGAPAPGAASVGRLQAGDPVDVLEVVEGEDYGFGRSDWVKLRRDGLVGFAAGYYIEIAPTPDGLSFGLGGAPEDDDPLLEAILGFETGSADASRSAAVLDLERVTRMADTFVSAANRIGVPAALLAAIASRETGCGGRLTDGWAENGTRFGVMGLTRDGVSLDGMPDPTALEHVEQAAAILSDCIAEAQEAQPEATAAQHLKAGLIAYRSEAGRSAKDPATDDDYASDLIARAHYFQEEEALSMFRD
jgi:hypothetical protein